MPAAGGLSAGRPFLVPSEEPSQYRRHFIGTSFDGARRCKSDIKPRAAIF